MSIFIEIKGVKYNVIAPVDGYSYIICDPNGKRGILLFNGEVEMEPGYVGKIVNWINANRRS